MDRELIKLAKKAGFGEVKGEIGVTYFSSVGPMLEAFAKLIIAAEREACAKVCEDLVAQYNLHSNFICARTIRARGGE